MVLRRTLAVASKELRHIMRNRLTLFLVSASPALLLFALAYVFSFDVDSANLAILDLDRSQASRNYIVGLTSNKTLSLAANATSYAAIDHLLLAGKVHAAVIIAPGFGNELTGEQPAEVQLIVDGSNPIIARQIADMVTGASAQAASHLTPVVHQRHIVVPADVRSRAWYNDTLESRVSMVPGLLGVVLSLPALALTLSLTREKELGTLEGLLATPLEKVAYLVGKMSAYLLAGVVGLLLSWFVAIAWFKVPFRGDLALFVVLTLAYFLATMGFSLVIASWISSQQAAIFVVMVVFFVPSFFLAGLIDPIDRRSPASLLLSMPLPATHYIHIARGIFLKGVGAEVLRPSSLTLLVMGVIGLLVSSATFRKRLG